MVRHQTFFDFLAQAEPDLPSYAPALAGLVVLGLVDAAREDPTVIDRDWTGVRAASDLVSSLREGHAVRRPLTCIVEQLRGEPLAWKKVTEALFAYGRVLDLEGNWSLAADVFGTVADIARADRNPEIAIEATTALGGAARRSGDWDRSAEGYAVAAHLADALGDRASGLTVRVGTANTHIARGNLPAAQEILDEVIEESMQFGLDGVAALAYHARSTVAHQRGEYAETVRLGYKALQKTTNPAVKDTILADIAAGFQELGMRDAARDAHLVVSLTSRYQWVRWQATINLLELAALDGMEQAFDDYAAQLRKAALDPRLKSYFLLYLGEGCVRFGRLEQAQEVLREAYDFASAHRINRVAFDAENALSEAGEKVKALNFASSWSAPIPDDVLEVAHAVSTIREAAFTAPASIDLM